MLSLRKVLTKDAAGELPLGGVVTLPFEQRRRSRLLVTLDDGREAALLLPRGTVLQDGQLLGADDVSFVVAVRAAAETLSVARTGDPLLLARAAYHLGNRHVPVEVGAGWVAYQHDHVLDGMVRELGLDVQSRIAPFEPEAGGYRHDGGRGHGAAEEHGHDHGHAHAARHAHDHPHDHSHDG